MKKEFQVLSPGLIKVAYYQEYDHRSYSNNTYHTVDLLYPSFLYKDLQD
jgi:hypothetical protein